MPEAERGEEGVGCPGCSLWLHNRINSLIIIIIILSLQSVVPSGGHLVREVPAVQEAPPGAAGIHDSEETQVTNSEAWDSWKGSGAP